MFINFLNPNNKFWNINHYYIKRKNVFVLILVFVEACY